MGLLHRGVAAVALTALVTATSTACGGNAGPLPTSPSVITESRATSPAAWTPVPADRDEALPPGRYGLTANGAADMPWAVVDVQGAHASLGQWALRDVPTGTGAMGYWTVTGVYRDPCSKTAGLIDVGDSAAGLAQALARQQRSRVTAPVAVTLDGHQGFYLELSAPSDIDFGSCGYDTWDSTPGGGRYLQEPGQIDRIWIVDVDGDTLVLNATIWSAAKRDTLQRLTAMVESVDFVARP